VIIVWL